MVCNIPVSIGNWWADKRLLTAWHMAVWHEVGVLSEQDVRAARIQPVYVLEAV